MSVNAAMLMLSFFSFIFTCSQAFSANQVEVSVPWLLELVVKHSDDIARQQNSLSADHASVLSIDSTLNPRLGVMLSHLEDNNERANNAALGKNATQKISANFSKAFSTGTSISAEIYSAKKEQEITAGVPPANQTNSFQESGLSFELRQSLLKNGFGRAYHASRESALTAKAAKKHATEGSMEGYLEALIDQYFSIWTAFNQLASAEERLKREQRRKNIYDRQFRRGFIEKKDILQIDSSILSAEKNVSDSSQLITSLLIKLGTVVKMDLYRQYIDKKIEIKFQEEKTEDVEKLCRQKIPELKSLNREAYEKRIQSFSKRIESIESNGNPDVYLAARVNGNGIDDDAGNSLTEASSLEHPQYFLAIGVDMILGNHANQAEKLEAIKSRSENEILLSQEKSQFASDWLETCNSLEVIKKKRGFITRKLDLDTQRLKLLDQDFRLGKTDLSTLLLAEDSLTNTKSNLASLSAQLYNTAWHLRRQSGKLRPYVNMAMSQRGANE